MRHAPGAARSALVQAAFLALVPGPALASDPLAATSPAPPPLELRLETVPAVRSSVRITVRVPTEVGALADRPGERLVAEVRWPRGLTPSGPEALPVMPGGSASFEARADGPVDGLTPVVVTVSAGRGPLQAGRLVVRVGLHESGGPELGSWMPHWFPAGPPGSAWPLPAVPAGFVAQVRAGLPREPEARARELLRLGVLQFQEGAYPEARLDLARAWRLVKVPGLEALRAPVALASAACLAELDRVEEAVRLVEKLLETESGPGSAERYGRYLLARLRTRQARSRDSRKELERALAMNPAFHAARALLERSR